MTSTIRRSKAREPKPKLPKTPRAEKRRGVSAALKRRAPASDFTPTKAHPLTALEEKALADARKGLAFLQTLWPVPIEPTRGFRSADFGVRQSLPRSLGDAHRALLRPVGDAIDHALNAIRSYEGQVNLPRGYKAPGGLYQTMPSDFSAVLRAENEASRPYQRPELLAALERIAVAWDQRYQHPDLLKTHPRPYYRETEADRLARLAGVEPGHYADRDLFDAKAAWARGEREVVFDQSIGNSTGATMGVTRRYTSEADFLRNFARARTGTFAHWQDV